MAEKVELFELDIDMEALLKKSATLEQTMIGNKAAIKDLNEQYKQGKVTTEDYSKSFVKLDSSLKSNKKEYNSQIKLIQAYSDKQTKSLHIIKQTDGSVNQLGAALNKNRTLYKDLTKEQRENAAIGGKLKSVINDQDKEFKELNSSIGQNQANVGNYKDSLNQLSPGVSGTTSKIIGMTKAAIAFIATPFGLILAAIAGALAAVKVAFNSSEEGQNKFNKIMAVSGVLLGNIMDIVAGFGEAVIAAVENPKQAWENFIDALKKGYEFVKSQVFDRFKAKFDILVGSFQIGALKLRIAWNEFTGDSEEVSKLNTQLDKTVEKVREAAEVIKAKNKEIVDTYTSINDQVKEFIEQNKKEAALAAKVADDRAKADKLDRSLLVERAKLESEIARLRLKSRKEDKFGAAERRQALLDAQKLEDQLLAKEVQSLKLRSEAITLENTFSRSNKENLDAEAEAKAKVLQIESKRLDAQRSTQRELNRLNKEIAAQEKAEAVAAAKEEADRIKDHLALFRATTRSKLSAQKELTSDLVKEEEIRLQHILKKNLELLELETISDEQRLAKKLELEYNFEVAKDELNQNLEQQRKDREAEKLAMELEEKLLRLDVENAMVSEIKLAQLEYDYQNEKKFAEQTGKDTTLIEKKYAKSKRAIDREETNAKLNSMGAIASNFASLAEDNTVIGKAAGAASAGISTYQGAAAALAPPPIGAGPILGPILAGSTILLGLKSVSKILGIGENVGKPRQIAVPSRHTGGLLYENQNIPTQPGGDNLLITAKRGEAVLTEAQQAALGGAMTFRAAGVPGFNTGGVPLPSRASQSSSPLINEESLAQKIADANRELPNPIVIIEEVADGLQKKVEVESAGDV